MGSGDFEDFEVAGSDAMIAQIVPLEFDRLAVMIAEGDAPASVIALGKHMIGHRFRSLLAGGHEAPTGKNMGSVGRARKEKGRPGRLFFPSWGLADRPKSGRFGPSMRKFRSPLEKWLWEKGYRKGRFAEIIGLSLKQIRPALAGLPPSIEAAHAIVEGTGGEIDYNALYARKPASTKT